MVGLKLCFYGISLLTGFLLHVVGVFSPCFFTYHLYSRYYYQTELLSYGIDPGIPWGNWFKFAVYTSYLSVACQIFVIAMYVYIVYESHNHKFSQKRVTLLKLVKWTLLVSTLLIIGSIQLITLVASWQKNPTLKYGYSFWLLVGAICMSPFNILVARRFEESAALKMKQTFAKVHPLSLEIPNDFVVLKSGYSQMSDL